MIAITKEEARIIRHFCPRAYIIRTMKQKSKRGHYFIDESPASIHALERAREILTGGGEDGGVS